MLAVNNLFVQRPSSAPEKPGIDLKAIDTSGTNAVSLTSGTELDSTQLRNRGATGSGSFLLKQCEIQSFCSRVIARLRRGRYRSSVL
jgi:hypothetical protein